MAFKPKKTLEEMIPNAPPDGIDLLKRLLQFNPDKRLTAEEALKHPYVARFHNPDDEPGLDCDIIPPLDDDIQLSVEEYRVKLYEVCTFNLIARLCMTFRRNFWIYTEEALGCDTDFDSSVNRNTMTH